MVASARTPRDAHAAPVRDVTKARPLKHHRASEQSLKKLLLKLN
jgi:hypothetical protein